MDCTSASAKGPARIETLGPRNVCEDMIRLKMTSIKQNRILDKKWARVDTHDGPGASGC